MAKLDRVQVEHVAKLAKLPISSKELSTFQEQLTKIVEYVGKIAELKTENSKLKTKTKNLKTSREDKVKGECLTQEEATGGAKNVHNGLFVVPAIFEE